MKKLVLIIAFLMYALTAFAVDGLSIVEKAYDHMRGETSESEVEMRIHRPDFDKSMTMKVWTMGRSDAVYFITSPKKDAGNGSLKKGRQMWMYNPKVNRVIKLPPSMMSQSWMGSDFSNNDLAKADTMVDDYTHNILAQSDGVYTVESIPKEGAAVVWGKVSMQIREDGILISQTFYDQDMKPVKELETLEINSSSGRLFPMHWIMRNLEEEGRYTEIGYKSLKFDIPLSEHVFTTTYMKSMGE